MCFQALGVRSKFCFFALLFPDGWETTESKRQLFEWELVCAPKHFCCRCLGDDTLCHFAQDHNPWLTRGANGASPSSHWHSLGGGFTFCSTGCTLFAGLSLVLGEASLLLLGCGHRACQRVLPCPVLCFVQALVLERNVKWCRCVPQLSDTQEVSADSLVGPSSLSSVKILPRITWEGSEQLLKLSTLRSTDQVRFTKELKRHLLKRALTYSSCYFMGPGRVRQFQITGKKAHCCSCVQGDKWDCSSKNRHINLASILGKIIQRHIGDVAGKELKDSDAIKYHWYHNMGSNPVGKN